MTSQDPPEERLGRIVRERRVDLGWSQNELAVKAGVSDTTISKIETGRGATTQARKVRDLELALGWRAGSFRSVRGGGEPMVDEDVPPEGGVARRRPEAERRFYPLPGSTSTPPNTEVPAYEVLPDVWVTTADPAWREMTPEERLERMKDRVNRAAPPDL